MKIELRYCSKCKRDTLQAVAKVLNYEASRLIGHWISSEERKGHSPTREEIVEQEQAVSHEAFYCPQCGKWRRMQEVVLEISMVEIQGFFKRIQED